MKCTLKDSKPIIVAVFCFVPLSAWDLLSHEKKQVCGGGLENVCESAVIVT